MKKLSRFDGIAVIFTLVLLLSCMPTTEKTPVPPDNTETIQVEDLDIATGQTIYVPAYSEIYYATNRTLNLAVTLSG